MLSLPIMMGDPVVNNITNNYTLSAPNSNPSVMFSSKEYSAWRQRLFIELKCYYNCSKATIPIPQTETRAAQTDREEQEMRAYGIAYSRLANNIIYQSKKATNFRELITLLDAAYERKTLTQSLLITNEIRDLRLNPYGDSEEYFAKLDSLITQLEECGEEISDGKRCQMYLTDLPRILLPIQMTCAGNVDSGLFKSAQVRLCIIQECQKLRASNSNTSDDRRKQNHHSDSTVSSNSDSRYNGEGASANQPASSSGNSNNGSQRNNGLDANLAADANSNGQQRSTGYQGKRFDKSKVTCYRCKERGHYSNECLVPPKENLSAQAATISNDFTEELLWSR